MRVLKVVRLVVLLAALAAGSAAALLWFGGERLLARYKPEIERAFSDAVGGRVRVSTLRVALLPRLGLEARGVEMRAPNGESPWRIDHLKLVAGVRALFEGRLEVHRIIATGLEGEVRTTAPASGGGASPPWRGIDLSLHKFELRNSRLTIAGETGRWNLLLNAARGSLARHDDRLVISRANVSGAAAEVPFDLSVDGLAWEEGCARVGQMALNLGPARLSFSGRLGPGSEVEGKITARDLDIPSISPLLAKSIGRSSFPLRGKLDAQVDLSGAVDSIKASAKVSGESLAFGASQISKLNLSRLQATIKDGALSSVALDAVVTGIEIQTGQQRYRADAGTVQGTIEHGAGWKMKGAVSARNFGFSDGTTDIHQVNANVSDIKGTVNKGGDVTLEMLVDGSSIALKAPSVDITSVQRVLSPLRVSVPGHGGYSVSGPVSAAGAGITLAGRKLEAVSGTVDILVSGPLKEFKTDGLEARSGGEKLLLSAAFSMLSDAYRARLTALRIGGGTLEGSWSMGRGADIATRADLRVSTVDIRRAYLALMQKEGTAKGTLQSLRLNAAAQRGDLRESANGSGSFVLYGESSNTYSLRDQIWRAIARVPGAGSLVTGKDRLDNPEDRETRAEISIAGGKIHFKKLTAKRSGYTIEGDPWLSLDGKLGGGIRVIFLKEKLRSLGFGIEPLGELFSRSVRISIPLTIAGTLDDPDMTPDYGAIAKSASGLGLAQSIAEGIANQGKKIGRALNRSDDPADKPSP